MILLKTAPEPVTADHWLQAINDFTNHPGDIEVVETPLSWVFLTDRHAFKLKKSIDRGEAHYSSGARRRQACIDEIWLNQRLAADVYQGVLPVTRAPEGGLRLGGKGVAVDWVVKMRRLRAECNLLHLISRGTLAREQVLALACALAVFYHGRPPETDVLDKLCTRLHRRVAENAVQLKAGLPAKAWDRARRLHAAQEQFLSSARMMLNLRVCDGRIVDGHGDLRPEHVFLERRAVVIDCVEYSADLRKTDVLDDISLLTMECERLGRDDVGAAITAEYACRTGDESFPHLEAFYKSLHAMSQASAAAQQAQQVKESRATSRRQKLADAVAYIEHANRYVSVFD